MKKLLTANQHHWSSGVGHWWECHKLMRSSTLS